MPAEPEPTIAHEGGASAPGDRVLRCPTCRAMTFWVGNSQRPFCSLTCRLIDLGVWLDEGYAVRGDPPNDVR